MLHWWTSFTLALGRLLAALVNKFFRATLQFKIDFERVNQAIALGSIDENMFEDPEIRKIFLQIRDEVAESPEDLPGFVTRVLDPVFRPVYNQAIAIVTKDDIYNFQDAQAAGGRLIALMAGFMSMITILDTLATGLTGTLVRNIVHISRAYISTFGLDRFTDAAFNPAISTGMVPWLMRGYNDKYQAQLPGASDIVRFQLREVFNEQQRANLIAGVEGEDFYRWMAENGFNRYWAESYWGAHWVLPPIGQLNEMLHRGEIEQDEWEKYVKYNDYIPAMIPKLNKIIYNPFTRVDVRRMWDMGVLEDEPTIKAYKDIGYDTDNAKLLLQFTKLFERVPELRARYKNQWINADELRAEVLGFGYAPSRIDAFMESIIKNDGPERMADERKMQIEELARAVHEGDIATEFAVQQMYSYGYNKADAIFALHAHVDKLSGSPHTEAEFERLAREYRAAVGDNMTQNNQEELELQAEIDALGKEIDRLARLGYTDEAADLNNQQGELLVRLNALIRGRLNIPG